MVLCALRNILTAFKTGLDHALQMCDFCMHLDVVRQVVGKTSLTRLSSLAKATHSALQIQIQIKIQIQMKIKTNKKNKYINAFLDTNKVKIQIQIQIQDRWWACQVSPD